MSPQQIKWVESPSPRWRPKRGGRYTDFLNELRRHPGRWAVLPDDLVNKDAGENAQRQQAVAIRKGVVTGAEPGEFEAVSRKIDGAIAVYVRYVGTEEVSR